MTVALFKSSVWVKLIRQDRRTGDLDSLDCLGGVVGDVNIDADGLSVVIQLFTMHHGKRGHLLVLLKHLIRRRSSCKTDNMKGCVLVCTSLSSEASRWRDLSDIRKLRVVSTIGWGPGFSGAYWTFLITRRTEFLPTIHTHKLSAWKHPCAHLYLKLILPGLRSLRH